MQKHYKNRDAKAIDNRVFNNPQTCEEFTVSYSNQPSSSEQSSTGGFSNDDNSDNSQSKKLYEPLVPATNPNSLIQATGGTADSYSYEWISHDKYPMKSVISFNGMNLLITQINDYKNHYDIYIYYLKGQDNNVPSQVF